MYGMEIKSEIFSQRLITAVIWNIGLQSILAIGLVFLMQIDLFHPLTWITSTFYEIFGWKMIINVMLLGLVSLFQAYIYGIYYMAPLPKYFTRFSMFLSIFKLQNIMFIVLYALSGYFTMGLYSSLARSNFTILKRQCQNYDGQCLMEQSLFLQLGGMWMGLYYYLSVHIFGTTTLMFPHIYQDKFQQIKMAINNIISMGIKKSILPVLYYCIFYYLWGNKPRSVVSDLYSLYLESPPLDNITNLLKSGIWIGLWFYTSLFFVSIYTMRTVFNVVLTEPIKFPIESQSQLTLQNALAQKTHFNGHLGAHDLRVLSMTDLERRLQIFSLTQPGGHTKNWNGILEKCLNIINDFNKEIENINGEAKTPVEMGISSSKTINVTPQNESFYSSSLRSLSTSPKLYELKDHNRNKVEDTFGDIVKREMDSFFNKLSQKPGISYFFGEHLDTKLKFVLMQSQPVIWTCEGLAFLVAASLKEDKYGVVQNDLPKVITTMVNLKQNIDKLTKLGMVPRKQILNDVFAIKMRSALISSVKRSIYKIVITFSEYIHEIPLDYDVRAAIESFLLCVEP